MPNNKDMPGNDPKQTGKPADQRSGNFANDPQRAAEAGRKGGQHSGQQEQAGGQERQQGGQHDPKSGQFTDKNPQQR